MSNSWVNVLLAFCTIGIAALPPTGDLFTSNPRKRPTWRYWLLVLLTIGIFFLGLVKDNNAAVEQLDAQRKAKNDQDVRDSLALIRTDESNKRIVAAFADGLGKYQLRYDSSTNEVIRVIRDSAKRIISAPEEEPSLLLDINPVVLDSSTGNIRHFSLYLKSFKGNPDNVNVSVYVVKAFGNELSVLKRNPDVGIANESLPEGMKTILPVELYASNGAIVYFYVFGSYTNKKKTLKFPFSQVCFFDLTKGESGFLTSFMDNKIREIFKKNR
ncbi:MAG: hypothetical protein ABW007_17505 [Chitinophagaceae bacterium]